MFYTIDRRKDLNHTFITSDHHFGHANIIKFCNRPFESVDQMDQAMIDNWNKVVKPKDTVYHLGDFTLGDSRVAKPYFNKLNGYIRILANPWHHDKRWLPLDGTTAYLPHVEIMPPMVVLEIPGLGKNGHPLAITLCHYPLAVWDRKHYSSICFHGHCHSNYQGAGLILDVGIDSIHKYVGEYRPMSLAEAIKAAILRTKFDPSLAQRLVKRRNVFDVIDLLREGI